MKDYYRRIDFPAGTKIDEMVKKLQEYNDKNQKVSTEFDDKIFYSDTITLEDAYLQITGMTKEDFEKFKNVEMEKAQERQEFIKYFGYNQKLYLALLPLKKDGEFSWKEIYENFKWGNIDLENGTINIPVKEELHEDVLTENPIATANDLTTKTFEDGIKHMEEKMLAACESGKCLELQGRAYYIIDDITHMRMMFDNIEKENS